MKKIKPFRIKANYSFWRHPLKWLKEWKMRRLVEKMMIHDWENGGEERTQRWIRNYLLYGGYPIPHETSKDS